MAICQEEGTSVTSLVIRLPNRADPMILTLDQASAWCELILNLGERSGEAA